MATTNQPAYLQFLEDHSDAELEGDNESLASLETDDGEDHHPEKILTELNAKNGFVWYLVKWQDCPVLRSSWEGEEVFLTRPWILAKWLKEKQKQLEGKSTPLDLAAFNKAVQGVEEAKRQRRILRRLKRQVNRVLSIVTT